MPSNNDLFVFKEEPSNAGERKETGNKWKVLSVEDDLNYQDVLRQGLADLTVSEKGIEFLRANTAQKGADILSQHPDISVLLLDVVMETDDAGLRLVDTIREVICNSSIRIILLTGQPSMSPRLDVMAKYDINEYWNKADLSHEKLRSIVTGNIRSWTTLNELDMARKGLLMLIEASRNIASKTDLHSFSDTLLREITLLTGSDTGSAVCSSEHTNTDFLNADVIASSGRFEKTSGQTLKTLLNSVSATDMSLTNRISDAIKTQSHQFHENITVLYFNTEDINGHYYITLIDTPDSMSNHHINILRVFCENINTGFNKVALLSRLTNLAYRDTELKIPNRNWLVRELDTLNSIDREHGTLVVFKIKNLNDIELSVGHQYCILLLEKIHEQLSKIHPTQSVTIRLEDTLFGVLFRQSNVIDDDALSKLSDLQLNINETMWNMSLSIIRLDLADFGDATADIILSNAKAALTKNSVHSRYYSVFDQKLRQEITHRQQIMIDLNKAIKNEEFFLALQPKVNLKTKTVIGFEALIRWRNVDGKIIPPDEFIPIAESAGMISKIDSLTLNMTMAAIKALIDAGFPLPVSFNATSDDLINNAYIELLKTRYQQCNIPPSLLDIEITESAAMKKYDEINPILRLLINIGFSVSIDDFGTGYSSLSHLNNLCATNLKIDRSFVTAMTQHADGEVMIDIILKMSQRLKLNIIAEGIETEEQREMLIKKGCIAGQGYLFGKPMELPVLLKWLADQPRV